MWIFTQNGFISAVQKRGEDKLTVRARDRQSLQPLADMANVQIASTPYADYQFRVVVTHEDFSAYLDAEVMTLDYDNFKNRIWATRGDCFHDACSDVWVAMLQVTTHDEDVDTDERGRLSII